MAHIRFFVRESDPDATVQVVGPNVKVVRTLYRGPLMADRAGLVHLERAQRRREPCPTPTTATGSG